MLYIFALQISRIMASNLGVVDLRGKPNQVEEMRSGRRLYFCFKVQVLWQKFPHIYKYWVNFSVVWKALRILAENYWSFLYEWVSAFGFGREIVPVPTRRDQL